MTRYKIQAKSVTGTVLVYHVDKYEVIEDFVTFLDNRTQEIKNYLV